MANGGPATLEFDGEQLAVQAVPATDASSIERASQEFLSKYRSSPYAASIVRQDVLETTLRLDPASSTLVTGLPVGSSHAIGDSQARIPII